MKRNIFRGKSDRCSPPAFLLSFGALGG